MDAGSSSSSNLKGQSRYPLLPLRKFDENLDRFIPNRSAMDFDYAHHMLNGGKKKGKEDLNPDSCFGMSSPSREAYRRQLAEIFNMNRGRILAFKNKPPTPFELIPQSHSGSGTHHSKPTKPHRLMG